MNAVRTRRRVVVDDSPLAHAIGQRLRQARLAAGLTQQQLAGERYTKAYISALENGIAKPSMAALNYLAPRLGKTASQLLSDPSRHGPVSKPTSRSPLAIGRPRWTATRRSSRRRRHAASALSSRRPRRDALPARPSGGGDSPCDRGGRHVCGTHREADRARAEYWLGSAHDQQDNPDEARGILRGILDRTRAGLDLGPDFVTRLLIGLATLESYQGAPTTALAYLRRRARLPGTSTPGAAARSLRRSHRPTRVRRSRGGNPDRTPGARPPCSG